MDTAIERFRELLRIPTVSYVDETLIEWERFDEFAAAIERLYPATHAALELEIIEGHSMLFRWRGSGTGQPTILMAHQDVVPVVESEWDSPPFGADLTGTGDDRVIRARGAIDDKGALAAILEAVESLILDEFVPANDVYLVFGHNEETTGSGARAIATALRDRGVRASVILDEGGAVVEGVFPGVTVPTAMIGVAERGVLTLRLTATELGGHASTPPRTPVTARLARAITRIHGRPFPVRLSSPVRAMLASMARFAPEPLAWILANTRITGKGIATLLSRLGPELGASVRTTAVVTQLEGAAGMNVLATNARAWVNIRLLPGDTVDSATEHVRRAIRDNQIEIDVVHGNDPSTVSAWRGEAWTRIAASVRSTLADDVYPEGPAPTPYLQLGASDSRWFQEVSDSIYRFTPFFMSKAEREALHSHNERIRVDSWTKGIEFYRDLLRRS